MREKYLKAKVLVAQGRSVRDACRAVRLSESAYREQERCDRAQARFYESEMARKLLLLFMILVSMTLIGLAFLLR